VDARPTPCLDLELLCGGTRSLGCRQRPPDPPRERLRTHRWGHFFGAPLGYLIFLLGSRRHIHHQHENIDGGPPGGAEAEGPGAPTINVKTSTAGPREVPELKVWERHHQRENVDGRPSGGAGAEGLGAPTINVKTLTVGPREVPELKVQERSSSM
jgi:hypothetical protein